MSQAVKASTIFRCARSQGPALRHTPIDPAIPVPICAMAGSAASAFPALTALARVHAVSNRDVRDSSDEKSSAEPVTDADRPVVSSELGRD